MPWVKQVREVRLPEHDPVLRGLDQDHDAAIAARSNGPVEGVNIKPKLIERRTHGRAGLPLLRHRILLA